MFELTRNFLRFYFPYHMNTVNREQELENLQKDHVIDELNQVETELNQLRKEVERLKPLAEIGRYTEMAYSKGFCLIIGEYDAHSDRIQSPFAFSIDELIQWGRKQKDGGKVEG